MDVFYLTNEQDATVYFRIHMKQFILVKVLSFFFLALILCSCEVESGNVYATDAGAINGYDPVAYFSSSMPVKGLKDFSTEWSDATWYFASEENLKAFKSDPVKYAPQYGGYCAYGTAEGHKAPTQPDAWTIVNGKLYLNYNAEVKRYWLEDQTNLIIKADSNWSQLKSAN